MLIDLSITKWSVGLILVSALCWSGQGNASYPGVVSKPCSCFSGSSSCCSKLAPMTSEAIQIVLGRVGEQYSEGSEHHSIWTYVELLPLEILKGSPGNAASAITVAHRGGRYPNSELSTSWLMEAHFATGDTVLVMLRHDWENDQAVRTRVIGGRHGQFNIENGRIEGGEFAGCKASTFLECVRDLIEARRPGSLASSADLVCLGEVLSREQGIDSTGEFSTGTSLAIREVFAGDASGFTILVLKQACSDR